MVILKDHASDPGADPNGDFDITARCNVVELFDGAPISVKITLDAGLGKFITKTPKIKRYDRIYVEFTDRNGLKTKTVVFVDFFYKSRANNKGIQLELICPHESKNLLTQPIMKPNIRESGFNALTDIINQINTNRGTKDPQIVVTSPFDITNKLGNHLSQSTYNNYIFEYVKAEKAIEDILNKEAQPVENGGALQWYYFRFVSLYDHATHANFGKVGIQVFEQGFKKNGSNFTNVPSVTLKKNPNTSSPGIYISTDRAKLSNEQGTKLDVFGNKSAGTFPKNYSVYQGEKDQFRLARDWDSNSVFYKTGIRVSYLGVFYKCVSDHTSSIANPPISTPFLWISDNVFTPSTDYSPLTKTKAQYWINAMAGWRYAGTSGSNKTAVYDPSIIIRDNLHNRTWADCTVGNPTSIPAELKPVFNNLRVLVKGTLGGTFAGSDPNGVSFANNLAVFIDPKGDGSGNWYVKRVSQTDDEIVILETGESWVYKACEGVASFVDSNGVCQLGTRNGGWVRGTYSFTESLGLVGHFIADQVPDCLHPVKRGASNVEVGNEKIVNDDSSGNSAVFVNFDLGFGGSGAVWFAGLNFTFPWPRNSNSVPWGAVSIGEQIKLTAFDILNMHQTKTKTRITFGEEIEEYFPIQGFSYFQNLIEYLPAGLIKQDGDYSFGFWIADTSDNIIEIDYSHSHNNSTHPIDVGLAKAKIKRNMPGTPSFLPTRQPEVLDVFDWRNCIIGGFYTKDSFDKYGRYLQTNLLSGSLSRFAGSEKLHLSVDAFRGTKPLVTTNISNSAKPDRNISPEPIKAEGIVSYAQLKNLAKSLEQIYAFTKEEYPVKTQLRCDIVFGDPVYYTDNELIDETTDAKVNTIKGVADSITYSVSKTPNGPGGYTRLVNVVTRIWPS